MPGVFPEDGVKIRGGVAVICVRSVRVVRGADRHDTRPHPMKKRILILGATAGLILPSFAATVTVVNFGEQTNISAPSGVTLNGAATTTGSGGAANATIANLLDTSGAATGVSMTATGMGWFSMGGPGSFAPVGTVTYDGSSALVNGWTTGIQTAYGNIWQRGANGDSTTGTLAFSGLSPDTAYVFTLVAVRANGFLADPGTYSMTYGGTVDGVDVLLSGAGTLDAGTKVVSGSMTGNASGLNAREINWSFTTGASPEDAVLTLTGDWNINALVIQAVPEPSSALLAGLASLAFLRRRR